MTWLTWRQFRTQAGVAFAVVAVIAITLSITGPHLLHLYNTSVATCQARGDCGTVTSEFLTHYRLLQFLGTVLVVVPGVIGIFWGAPLVARELETGTFRLAWTQSVSRTRWLAVKLAVVGLASMAVAGLFSLMVTWWSSPIDRVTGDRFAAGMFGERGIAPIGYAAFAFALGVTAGVLIRRTLPAMATALVAFVAARVTMTLWVRPHLIGPIHISSAFRFTSGVEVGGAPGGPLIARVTLPDAWVYSFRVTNAAGQAVSSDLFNHGACLRSRAATDACAAKLRQVLIYQPASRFWPFQWYETAIFLAVALMLGGFCFWWIRRRIS